MVRANKRVGYEPRPGVTYALHENVCVGFAVPAVGLLMATKNVVRIWLITERCEQQHGEVCRR